MGGKIIIASDSFKGSATSLDIGNYISESIQEEYPEYSTEIFAVADGGEGTVRAILSVLKGEIITKNVKGPLGNNIQAEYGLINNGKTAIIEMAEASGLTLVDETERDIMQASTFGTGQLIVDALSKEVEEIYIGIGGSATNDGGIGAASALGVKFLDDESKELKPIAANLSKIQSINNSNIVKDIEKTKITILSDVTNPLCGEFGASAIYGPQKGASKKQIQELDKALKHYAKIIFNEFGLDILEVEGAGAAGGLGAGLMVFANANYRLGIESILELIQIEKSIKDADLVITGEGSIDGQSSYGKAPTGIAKLAKKYNIPVVAIVGRSDLDLDLIYKNGIDGVFDIIYKPMTLEDAISNTEKLVKAMTKNILHFYNAISNY
ncbi:glycerate kinase [Atopostipes suicloacalis DSM 15692]|uniref:Glycerate kinase n=1 Tax=Atopostipes suicloacalis DSM 15692 TaxID=1121025 RepID=A0A1M4YC31_9LACT|nr:glycerate kinase [Atopostipes suicloacalis]SHF03143.1 glycerate kinase [Atopostipes suicloacalis DSM 15692]